MQKNLTKFITKLAHNMGYSVLPLWKLEDESFAKHLAKVFIHYKIKTVLDIGANQGQYRDFLRERVGFSGTIHSFEPIPHLAEEMRTRSKNDPKWHVHNIALGSSSGDLALNVMARNTFSSFRDPSPTSLTVKEFSAGNSIVEKITVPVHRLDDFISNCIDVSLKSTYLKIDTQGFDIEVIRGALNFLELVPAMQFELAIQRLYENVPDYYSMLKTVESLGFEISGFFPISNDKSLRAVEFDCVMVRQVN